MSLETAWEAVKDYFLNYRKRAEDKYKIGFIDNPHSQIDEIIETMDEWYEGTIPLTKENFPPGKGNLSKSNILTELLTNKELNQNPSEWTLMPGMKGGKSLTPAQQDSMLDVNQHLGKYDSKKKADLADSLIHLIYKHYYPEFK
jgi:hypothetical protein